MWASEVPAIHGIKTNGEKAWLKQDSLTYTAETLRRHCGTSKGSCWFRSIEGAARTHHGRIIVALCSVSTGRANEGKSSCTASLPMTPMVAVSAETFERFRKGKCFDDLYYGGLASTDIVAM